MKKQIRKMVLFLCAIVIFLGGCKNTTEKLDESNDIHSIWIDGYEIKIMEYLDNENMVIKFALGNAIIQCVAPRNLENEDFVAIYSQESWSDTTEIILRFVHVDRTSAVMFSYIKSEEAEDIYYDNVNSIEENETQFSFQTMNKQDGYIQWGVIDDIIIESDDDATSLQGYMAAVCDVENQWITSIAILSEIEDKESIYKEYLRGMVVQKQRDTDFKFIADAIPEDYDVRMKTMYEQYRRMIKNPTSYLYDNYNAPGAEYGEHYLYDLTNDGIPEIIFLGTPRWICIVGENNAVHIPGGEIAFSEENGEIYVCYGDFWEEKWSKYCVESDENGSLVINCIEKEYLQCKVDYSSDEGEFIYTHCGMIISEPEFYNKRFELYRNNVYNPQIFDGYEYVASKKGFYRSTMTLNDELIFEYK